MRIAHLTSVHSSNDNRIFYKECTTLQGNGFEVFLVAAGAESDVINGVSIVGYNKESGNRIKRMFKTSFMDMLYQAKKIDADIYHFHDPELIFVGLSLKFLGKKVIYDIHENNPASILSKPYIKSKLFKYLLSIVFNILEQFSVKFFDAIVTARPDISNRFRHKKLVTLRNFPMLPDFSKLKNIDIEKLKPAIIYVGGISSIRGINELLDAFETLDEYELWLLGPVNDPILESRINSGCRNVKYFGVVEPFEIFSYIQKADVGIVTFLDAPNHVTTLATKPFEYMACGIPMIMSDFEYWRDTFGDSSLYVDPSNINEIREVIVKLISDQELMSRMGRLNKNLTDEVYNWDKESQKLIKIYDSFSKEGKHKM